jgi:hypothetical protein
MVALVSLLVVIALSLLITRIAAVALTLTGLSPQIARFQARSAFTRAVVVLGIERSDDTYLGAPTESTRLHRGDIVTVYERRQTLENLHLRPADARGEQDRRRSQAQHREHLTTQ